MTCHTVGELAKTCVWDATKCVCGSSSVFFLAFPQSAGTDSLGRALCYPLPLRLRTLPPGLGLFAGGGPIEEVEMESEEEEGSRQSQAAKGNEQVGVTE